MSIIFSYFDKNHRNSTDEPFLANIRKHLTANKNFDLESAQNQNPVFYCAHHMQEPEKYIVENEDRSVLLMMGGRIFGYRHKIKDLLKRGHVFKDMDSPAEFVLHSFEDSGMPVFKSFNGIFSFMIWIRPQKRLIIANDVFGLYPLFIYDSGRAMIACSEYQPIMQYRDFRDDLNHEAIAEYFLVGATLKEKTFFRSINKLPPASIFDIKGKEKKLYQYDSVDIEIKRNKPKSFFAEKIDEKFKSVLKTLVDEHKVRNCDLTGGFDTRFILGCLSPEARKRMRFITRAHPSLKEDLDRDIVCSKILAKTFQLKHDIVPENESGDFDSLFFENIRHRNSSDKKTLNGMYGTAFLGGTYLSTCRKFLYPHEELKCVNKTLTGYFSKSFINQIDGLDDLRYYSRTLGQREDASLNNAFVFSLDLLTRAFFTLMYGTFSGWMCPYENLLKMALYPFLDRDLLKILLTVPEKYISNYNLYLTIMKTYHRHLMDFPFASCACHDPGIKQLTHGASYFSVARHRYNHKFLESDLKKPASWNNKNYSLSFCRRMKLKRRVLLHLKEGDSTDMEMNKFLNFDAWQKYHLPEE